MKTSARFFHAGSPACVAAEQFVSAYLDRTKVDLEIVHLGRDKSRLPEAEQAGVRSVPALVVGRQTLHLDFGADLAALR